MKTAIQLIKKNPLLFHLSFCCLVLAFLFLGMYLLFVSGFRFKNPASAYTDCFYFLLCIYTGRWLALQWYLRNRLGHFLGFTLMASVGLTIIKWLLVKYAFNHPNAGFFELSRDVMPFFLIGLVIGMLLKITRATMQKEIKDAHIKSEQKAMEFDLLQSQLSPHFLFNVLNNLYGIAINEHQRVPQLLLKLSDLLRYSIYGAKKTIVPLKDELEYIRNYIEFEQIRISDRLVIETDLSYPDNPDVKIAPLLLIVFVENAFKHAKNSFDQKIFISIRLKISGDFINFKVANSYQHNKKDDEVLNENSGLGLDNTIKRLELLYAGDYKLKQYTSDDLYFVELNLKMRHE